MATTSLAHSKPTLPIHFFKIILQTNLQRIKIPNNFTRIYGGNLSNPVFLRTPDLKKWEVQWRKENGQVWLEKGWKEFVENYCMGEGHFVLFKYEGTSHIEVLIFDRSAMEIDFVLSASDHEMDQPHQSGDESVEILDVKSSHQNSSFVSSKSREKLPRRPTLENVDAKILKDEKLTKRICSLNWPRQFRAQEVARNFISCNPFFTVLVNPVHVATYKLPIPDLKDIIEMRKKYVTLKFGERSWNVKIVPPRRMSSSNFGSGWSLFATEAQLQPGDVCVFELISRNNSVFQVHVFKSHA